MIVERQNDYSYMVKNLATDRMTLLHINDIKLDKKRMGISGVMDNKEDRLEEGTDFLDGRMSKGPDKDDQTEKQDKQMTNEPPESPNIGMTSRPKRVIRAPDRLGAS